MAVCPRCHKKSERLLALSRFNRGYICEHCGTEEAFEWLMAQGVITEERYHSICAEIAEAR